jgi:hypothetical protein
VTVSDTTAPVVTVLGDNPASVVVDGVFADAGATAADLVDGDVSGGIAAPLASKPAWIASLLPLRSAPDAVAGSSTGIAMCKIIGPSHEPPMSPSGTKAKFSPMLASKHLPDVREARTFRVSACVIPV